MALRARERRKETGFSRFFSFFSFRSRVFFRLLSFLSLFLFCNTTSTTTTNSFFYWESFSFYCI